MTDTASINGGPPLAANQINPIAHSVTVLPGMAVIPSTLANKISLGKADAAATSRVIGIATSPGGDGDHVRVTYVGPVVLATADWDAVAGTSGGLTPQTAYYLSAATAGHITSTKPSSFGANQVVPIGYGIASNALMLTSLFPIVA